MVEINVDDIAIRNMRWNTLQFGKGLLEGHLAFPTYIRKTDFFGEAERTTTKAYTYGGFLPYVGTMMFGMYPAVIHWASFEYGNKTVATIALVTQLAANAASTLSL
jgi:hypothetical protein